jgi:hypothetical protein
MIKIKKILTLKCLINSTKDVIEERFEIENKFGQITLIRDLRTILQITSNYKDQIKLDQGW